jgi:hypothetical protein
MAAFVHITAEANITRIRRGGIRAGKGAPGVYAMPVLPDFQRSHQWLRELRRWKGGRLLMAVYFRLPGDTPVAFGRYNRSHAEGTADAAVAALEALQDAGGFEVAILRSVGAGEITSVKHLPQLTGWRYFPEAKGRKPFCTCDYCQKGLPFSRRLRE